MCIVKQVEVFFRDEKTVRPMNFYLDIPPVETENPAFTRHLILKRAQASWSQSVFSVSLGDKIIPNRDYPYEGLSVLINGENYHFMDGIAVGIKKEGQYVRLRPAKVTASPWKQIYHYENEEEHVNLSISYYLMNLGTFQNGITACLAFESNTSPIVAEPLFDIRHMYDSSEPREHLCTTLNDGLLVQRDDKYISIRIRTLDSERCEVRTWNRELEWFYKLGSGFRSNYDGRAVFIGEKKKLVSLGEIVLHANSPMLIISCTNSYAKLDWLHERGEVMGKEKTGAKAEEEEEEEEEEKNALSMIKSLGIINPAVGFRALALSQFGMLVNNNFFYEAGDFWFRTPWFRDQFEGIINNIETFCKIGHTDTIKDIILHSFEYQDEYGRIPNRFPERKNEELDYNNADATLLAFIAAGELLKRVKDDEFAAEIMNHAEFTISRFRTNDIAIEDGAPVLHEDGLLSAVPWHSWTDTRRANGVSVRIPDSWCEDAPNKPGYFLPEINAQWIKMLRYCTKLEEGKGKEEYQDLLDKARRSFKSIFWNAEAGNLYNIVSPDGKKDSTWGSPAVVAFALLIDEMMFSQRELSSFINGVKGHLLVYKNSLPIGILVKESPKSVYYSDEEYHEAVVWPRDTPYLIKLMRYAGEWEIVEGILSSNLSHQMDEGFVFYNCELFSPDGGEPTPVKNPIQFWSQWVDPYLITH